MDARNFAGAGGRADPTIPSVRQPVLRLVLWAGAVAAAVVLVLMARQVLRRAVNRAAVSAPDAPARGGGVPERREPRLGAVPATNADVAAPVDEKRPAAAALVADVVGSSRGALEVRREQCLEGMCDFTFAGRTSDDFRPLLSALGARFPTTVSAWVQPGAAGPAEMKVRVVFRARSAPPPAAVPAGEPKGIR